MSKGLAIIYDPHNLYQFAWYYCNQGRKKRWDALSLPNGYKGEYMHSYCERAGIFEEIYYDNDDFSTLNAREKCKQFSQMFFFFLVRRQKDYCKKLLNHYIKLDQYDEIVVIADVGMVSGACVALGEEKKIVILEDGINDYGDRSRLISREKIFSTYSWQGMILSHMGYCSPGWFRFDADRYCIKYCSQIDKMKYRDYKEMRQLYSSEGTDQELFNQLLYKMYPMLRLYQFQTAEAILITRPLEDFVGDTDKYKRRLEKYVNEHYSSVIVKKHPREDSEYEFEDRVYVQEIDNSIPVEVMLPYLKGKDIVIVTTSSVMLYLKAYSLKCKVIVFDGLYEESINTNSQFRPLDLKATIGFAEEFAEDCYEIVQI